MKKATKLYVVETVARRKRKKTTINEDLFNGA